MQTAELKQRGPTPTAFLAVGRLRDGVSLRQARTELETIDRRLEAAYPATNRGVSPTVFTHAEANSGADASIIWGSLWAAAWFVFLIACANLANLSLARSIGRAREYSTRIALGAGQGRMIRQVLMESLTIAAVAGTAGWWIAKWCVHQWDVVTFSMYQVLDYTVDFRTFSYLAAITLGAAILFSLAPVARVMQIGVNGVLKGEAQGVTAGPPRKAVCSGTHCGADGSGDRAAVGRRRVGAESRVDRYRQHRHARSRARSGWIGQAAVRQIPKHGNSETHITSGWKPD